IVHASVRGGFDFHAAGLAVAVNPKVYLVARLELAQLAGETAAHHARHVPVLDVSRGELEVHAVDRRDAVSFLDPRFFRRTARTHGAYEQAKRIACAPR